MVVVADSSPLNYLILMDTAEVLPQLFGEVRIPEAVFRELEAPGAPALTSAWLHRHPDWLLVQQTTVPATDPNPAELGAGEQAAIVLSLDYAPEVLLLMDETRYGARPGSAVSVP